MLSSVPFAVPMRADAQTVETIWSATGTPEISGTARVGETLTAAKGTIADGDGTTKADAGDTGYAYAYQWIRVDSDGTSNAEDISGATSTTYMPGGADVGKKVKVKVTFTDDVDDPETVTSDAYPPSGTIRAAGFCGRTPAIRDAIVARILGVTDCALVTNTHLGAIIELRVGSFAIDSLAAGDFDGLTALEWLELNANSLSTLPDGVFDELTALTTLDLSGNDLTTLPDGVFEPLTALTTVILPNNPGAPFSPEAVALPDDGTVPAGGSVTLDGSGSGGAWGTNVTYSWALTSPASGVTVMFGDAASATPEVPIPALTVGTELTFTLTVTGRGGGRGTAPATDTATVTVTASTDATLSDLKLEDGGGNSVSLTPPFASTSTSYTASVANGVDEITIKPTNDSSATFAYLDGSDMALTDADAMEDDFQVSLSTGANTIKVKVTAQDSVTTRTYTVAVRRATTANAATGTPEISGTARVGETLTAAKGTIADGDGTTKADAGDTGYAYAYQWIRVDSDGASNAEDISGATSTTYMPMGADVDKKVKVKVTFTDDVDNRETVTSGGYPPSGIIRAAGFCGRTPQVRDAIVAQIPGVSDCAAVTDTHLGAITGTLDLGISALAAGDFDGLTALESLRLQNNQLTTLPAGVFDGLTALESLRLQNNQLTTLPAGVFDGLTALESLRLQNNQLTTLPAGVFDGLTSLTGLDLNDNDLTTLPAGVFDGLTALTQLLLGNNSLTTLPAGVFDGLTSLTFLWLFTNSLTTLPDDVFEELTALTELNLLENPGAPFSPTADALPDDGTVPVAGGTVTLDGSGSGGAWGTNVTYSWALTSPASGVTVMFGDAASATPVVTIPALADDAELSFTLTVTALSGTNTAYGTAPATDTATVRAAVVTVLDTLALNLGTIATDDTVNIAEKAAGFAISGDTGSEAGVTVTVTVGGTELTATSDAGGAWSVDVPANATYLTGTSVTVTVAASKTGFTSPSDLTRTLAVDLTAPAASYTAPGTLKLGVAIGAMTPTTSATDIASYRATGLPSGLSLDTTTGVINGTPDTADASTASATVTVTDTAGNPADVSITFPTVAKGDQTLSGFVYSASSVTFGDTAPTVTAPSGVETTLAYAATPPGVCTVVASTGALTLVGVGACDITATAAGTANYNQATASFTVTVLDTLALKLDTIATDDTVNIAEKAAGFAISGDTGSEAGVTVTVTVGGRS